MRSGPHEKEMKHLREQRKQPRVSDVPMRVPTGERTCEGEQRVLIGGRAIRIREGEVHVL
jgi:hypothetical protein